MPRQKYLYAPKRDNRIFRQEKKAEQRKNQHTARYQLKKENEEKQFLHSLSELLPKQSPSESASETLIENTTAFYDKSIVFGIQCMGIAMSRDQLPYSVKLFSRALAVMTFFYLIQRSMAKNTDANPWPDNYPPMQELTALEPTYATAVNFPYGSTDPKFTTRFTAITVVDNTPERVLISFGEARSYVVYTEGEHPNHIVKTAPVILAAGIQNTPLNNTECLQPDGITLDGACATTGVVNVPAVATDEKYERRMPGPYSAGERHIVTNDTPLMPTLYPCGGDLPPYPDTATLSKLSVIELPLPAENTTLANVTTHELLAPSNTLENNVEYSTEPTALFDEFPPYITAKTISLTNSTDGINYNSTIYLNTLSDEHTQHVDNNPLITVTNAGWVTNIKIFPYWEDDKHPPKKAVIIAHNTDVENKQFSIEGEVVIIRDLESFTNQVIDLNLMENEDSEKIQRISGVGFFDENDEGNTKHLFNNIAVLKDPKNPLVIIASPYQIPACTSADGDLNRVRAWIVDFNTLSGNLNLDPCNASNIQYTSKTPPTILGIQSNANPQVSADYIDLGHAVLTVGRKGGENYILISHPNERTLYMLSREKISQIFKNMKNQITVTPIDSLWQLGLSDKAYRCGAMGKHFVSGTTGKTIALNCDEMFGGPGPEDTDYRNWAVVEVIEFLKLILDLNITHTSNITDFATYEGKRVPEIKRERGNSASFFRQKRVVCPPSPSPSPSPTPTRLPTPTPTSKPSPTPLPSPSPAPSKMPSPVPAPSQEGDAGGIVVVGVVSLVVIFALVICCARFIIRGRQANPEDVPNIQEENGEEEQPLLPQDPVENYQAAHSPYRTACAIAMDEEEAAPSSSGHSALIAANFVTEEDVAKTREKATEIISLLNEMNNIDDIKKRLGSLNISELLAIMEIKNIEIEYPEEFVCRFTEDIMRDPVMDKSGNTYERREIENWIRHNTCDLITGTHQDIDDLRPNIQLRQCIEKFLIDGLCKDYEDKLALSSRASTSCLKLGR